MLHHPTDFASATWTGNHISVTATCSKRHRVRGDKQHRDAHSGTSKATQSYSKWHNQFALICAAEHTAKLPSSTGLPTLALLSQSCGISTSKLSNQSVLRVVACMNNALHRRTTRRPITIPANLSPQARTSPTIPHLRQSYLWESLLIAVSLPSIFVSQPSLILNLSGAFTGVCSAFGKACHNLRGNSTAA
jgi:hypothetical protein